ncbi:uncharacterized protein LOC105698191 [Orussus abietinus]|uniref:uncharacterized protein LOC105698191 n=1 Tax=Orussus abietinus TaxID=222816 RepID=UPI0006256C46|nr:uncharacterized protein LOC105698191 [Orussus abietinus]
MDGFLFSIILAAVSQTIAYNVFPTATTKEYIDERLKATKVQIAKAYIQEAEPVVIKTYNIQCERLWRDPLSTKHPMAINMFDKTFILDDHRILSIALDTSPRRNSTLNEIAVIRQENVVKFVRSIKWKSVMYFLICHEMGSCCIYTSQDDFNLIHRQNIRHVGLPTDAAFFIQSNRLYLVIADNADQFPIPSTIYHWTGTYMDITCDVLTTGAVSVTTLRHKRSTIIVFAQNLRGNPKIGSEVFVFKHNYAERIQYLATDGPVFIESYSHGGYNFLLVVNEAAPSEVYWWDGRELLNWMKVPDIQSASLVKILHVADDTFFFVSRGNSLQLYKFMHVAYSRLELCDVIYRERIVDMGVWAEGLNITLVLVTMNFTMYQVEPWRLEIKKSVQENVTKQVDVAVTCLTELSDLLENTTSKIESILHLWPSIYPSAENVSIPVPLSVNNLIIEAGNISNIIMSNPAAITPEDIERRFTNLSSFASQCLKSSEKTLQYGKSNILIGNITVESDVFFKELSINSLHTDSLNHKAVNVTDAISSRKPQTFSSPLRGRLLTVHELSVDSLCGIPFNYWQLENDTMSTLINEQGANIDIQNDTILVQSDLSLGNLGVEKLNRLNVNAFLNDLFIFGYQQHIKGNVTYTGLLQVVDFTTQTLNEIPAAELITRTTVQNLKNVFIKSLNVTDLIADTVNGVPVSEAARKSKENIVKGQVTIGKLRVTEVLAVNSDTQLPIAPPVQVYDDVTILGDLFVNNVTFEQKGSLILNESKISIESLFDSSWTKSTDQTINNIVVFENGVTIDDLNATYLNGHTENEFIYTTAKEIPDLLSHLHFENLRIGSLLASDAGSNGFVFNDDSIVVNEPLQLEGLFVENLYAEVFNSISMNDLIEATSPLHLNNRTFKRIVVNDTILVQDLSFQLFNGFNISDIMEQTLFLNESYKMGNLTLPQLQVDKLHVHEIDDIRFTDLSNLVNTIDMGKLQHLSIDGSLEVEDEMVVNYINNDNVTQYLRNLARNEIVVPSQNTIFDNIVIHGNLTVNQLQSVNLEYLVQNSFSKSRPQKIPGSVSIQMLKTHNLNTKRINQQDVAKLIFADGPLIFEGNVTFLNLSVKDDVSVRHINNNNITQLYQESQYLPISRVSNLTVFGNMSWKEPLKKSNSLTHLFENAVTKDTNQHIGGEVTFDGNVAISSAFSSTGDLGHLNILKIMSDAVISGDGPLTIGGQKIFKQGVTVNSLNVDSNIDIAFVNTFNMQHLNSSIVRKFSNETVVGKTTFLQDITANKFIVKDSVHGSPVKGLMISSDTLPNTTVFEHLIVRDSVTLETLDGIKFDDFINNRVTLRGNHDVFGDVQFNDQVDVTKKMTAVSINKIIPSELFINGSKEEQIISGSTTFSENLIVQGDLFAEMVNNVNLAEEFIKGVFNDENVDIYGDIVFETPVEITNASISGLINGINLHNIIGNQSVQVEEAVQVLKEREALIDAMVLRSWNISQHLSNRFFYLDSEKNLVIEVPNIQKVDVIQMETITRLSMFGQKNGSHCGLPDICSCRIQYFAEISEKDCNVWSMNSPQIVFNFYQPNNAFGINVATNAVSRSVYCTGKNLKNESTTISWVKLEDDDYNLAEIIKRRSTTVEGYLSDVKVFTYNDIVYIVLAVYYNARQENQSHVLIYALNLMEDKISFVQEIVNDGVWAVDLFKIPDRGAYLLIGCAGYLAESLLYKYQPGVAQFQLLRTFATGGSRFVKNVVYGRDYFVVLDDPSTNSAQIFRYDMKSDNFYSFQSLYLGNPISGIEVFYAGEFGNSDAYVILITGNGQVFIYEYMLLGKFQLKSHHWRDGIQTMVPFNFKERRYMFAGTKTNSSILRVLYQGPP